MKHVGKIVILLAALLLASPNFAGAQSVGGNASLSVTTGSARVAFPANRQTYSSALISPAPGSTQETFYALGDSSVTATTGSPSLPTGGICVNIGPNTNVAAIVAANTATLRITQLTTCTGFSGAGGYSGTIGSVTEGTTPWIVTGEAPVSPGAAPTHALLGGCVYRASGTTATDGQAMSLGCDVDGALIAYAPPLTSAGNITTQNLNLGGAATAGSAIEIYLDGRSTLSVQVTGTWTGTLVLQTTNDGVNWVTTGGAPFLRETNGVYTATIASGLQDIWSMDSTGHVKARITASAAVTGTAAITVVASQGNARVNIGNAPAVQLAGQSFNNITTNTDTVVKASSGVFVGLIVNTPGTTSTAIVFNNTTCTGTKIGTFSTTSQSALPQINATAGTGVCVTTAGAAAADLTVLWR